MVLLINSIAIPAIVLPTGLFFIKTRNMMETLLVFIGVFIIVHSIAMYYGYFIRGSFFT